MLEVEIQFSVKRFKISNFSAHELLLLGCAMIFKLAAIRRSINDASM
jgi:hypothetical protein